MRKLQALIVFMIVNTSAFSQFSGGTGTVADPYQISNVTELQAMNTALDKHFILTQNIDATITSTWNSGQGFEPIGPSSSTPFTGTFDGKGFKIIKLTIIRQSTTGVGLFGNFNNSFGAISNVGLDSCVVIGNERVGALVGNKNGIVQNCYSTGSVNGAKSTGGLIGRNGGVISDSYSMCSVGGSEEVGGLVGVGSNITNCYATGNVFASLGDAGGLVGEVTSNGGTIFNCYASGNVTSTNSLYAIGGFIGRSQAGTIDLCYSTGKVSGNAVVGGFIGTLNSGTIKRSYSKCTMVLGGGTFPFGGFIAENESNVIDCYADVNMSYSGNNISSKLGGFAGENKDAGIIRNCYSVANLAATNGNRAGFVHTNAVQGFDTSKTFGCYFNTDSSAGLLGVFLDQTNAQVITGLTDVQMKSAANFSGWNFDTVWTITEGQTYPELRRPGSSGGCTNTYANDTVRACNSYKWINGVTYTSNVDTATFILPNAAGCDSVVTLKLTIETISNATIVNASTIAAIQTNATYQWIDCSNNSLIANATNQSFTATVTGSYAVIISKGSCVDTSSCVNIVISSVNSQTSEVINIYPNPTKDVLNFEKDMSGVVKIFNNVGQLVYEDKLVNQSTVQLKNINTGVYYLLLNADEGKVYQSKIMIE